MDVENFEVTQQNKLTKKGFYDLHKETVKDEQGGVSELWDTLQAMGYNKALQLDEVTGWPCFICSHICSYGLWCRLGRLSLMFTVRRASLICL